MRIAVFGCGGVGAYFGGRLAQIGQDVTFIARNENLAALRSKGLKFGSIAGDFVIDRVKATNDPVDVGIVADPDVDGSGGVPGRARVGVGAALRRSRCTAGHDERGEDEDADGALALTELASDKPSETWARIV